jgi:uncharacterized protein
MPSIPRHLRQLEKELADLPGDGEPMLVSALDGFLVCPDLIMPSKWLPLVWGDGGDDAAPVFESTAHAEKLIGLVMQHYNAIATDLQRGRFAPVFDVDRRHDEVLWELWIDGFEKARRLNPQSWLRIASGDEEACAALAGLITLAEISRGDSSLAQAEIYDLTEKAPELIPHWVESLNAWRISQHFAGQPENPKPSFAKVGRNDPCPCGSGKKYKTCCGLN